MKVVLGTTLLVLGMVAAFANAVSAAVIYDDSFSRTGALNGTAPDVTNVPSANWIAGSVTTDGAEADDAGSATAFLPIAVSAGNVYTLTADLKSLGGSNWEAFGFANATNSGSSWHTLSNSTGPWLLARGDGVSNADVAFAGVDTSNGFGVGFNGSVNGYTTYSIVLDTTAVQWKATWFRGVTQVGTFTYTTNPTLSYVGFGNDGVPGSIDNFSLTVTSVPEPNSIILLSAGAMGLMYFGRRRWSNC